MLAEKSNPYGAAPAGDEEMDAKTQNPINFSNRRWLLRRTLLTSSAICLVVLLMKVKEFTHATMQANDESEMHISKFVAAEKVEKEIQECLKLDSAKIYKYTIASSTPSEDAEWAADLFGCSYNKSLSYSCENAEFVGKLTCVEPKSFDLHFIWNNNTHSGPKSVPYWDNYMVALHKESFASNTYNAFMDYSLSLYTPNMTQWINLKKIDLTKKDFLLRKLNTGSAEYEWLYSMYISSPGGKAFEIVSAVLDYEGLGLGEILEWTDEECPQAHATSTYHIVELDHWFKHNFDLTDGYLLPIRTNVAANDANAVLEWYNKFMPGFAKTMTTSSTDSCFITTGISEQYNSDGFSHEIRFVSNPTLTVFEKEHTVENFIDYTDGINDKHAGVNKGWSAWYDRHVGLQVTNCSLDMYMEEFAAAEESFHPHTRSGSDSGLGSSHVWTPGTQGWGIEIQGLVEFSYASTYSVFDWCTNTTDPHHSAENGWVTAETI